MTPENVLAAFYEQLDGAIEDFETAHPCFRCPAGCSRCCVAPPFLISLVEYRLLCDYARAQLSGQQREQIRDRACERACHSTLSEVLRAQEDPDEEARLLCQECPLLEGERCAVYPARPLTCRMFGRTVFTEGHQAGRFNGCTILVEQARAAGETDRKLPMYSADRLRGQLMNLNRRIRQGGEVVGLNTLTWFIAQLGFDWEEDDVRHGQHVAFQPARDALLRDGD